MQDNMFDNHNEYKEEWGSEYTTVALPSPQLYLLTAVNRTGLREPLGVFFSKDEALDWQPPVGYTAPEVNPLPVLGQPMIWKISSSDAMWANEEQTDWGVVFTEEDAKEVVARLEEVLSDHLDVGYSSDLLGVVSIPPKRGDTNAG